MKRLKEEIDLAPLRPVLVFRPLLPRGRLHLQQIKREPIVRTMYEENVARKATNAARGVDRAWEGGTP